MLMGMLENMELFIESLTIVLITTILFGRRKFRTYIVARSGKEKPFELFFVIRLPEIVRSILGLEPNDYVDLRIIDENVKPVKKVIKKLIVRKAPPEMIHTYMVP